MTQFMDMGETPDVYKQRMEKKKAVVAINTVAMTFSVALSHMRKPTTFAIICPPLVDATTPS